MCGSFVSFQLLWDFRVPISSWCDVFVCDCSFPKLLSQCICVGNPPNLLSPHRDSRPSLVIFIEQTWWAVFSFLLLLTERSRTVYVCYPDFGISSLVFLHSGLKQCRQPVHGEHRYLENWVFCSTLELHGLRCSLHHYIQRGLWSTADLLCSSPSVLRTEACSIRGENQSDPPHEQPGHFLKATDLRGRRSKSLCSVSWLEPRWNSDKWLASWSSSLNIVKRYRCLEPTFYYYCVKHIVSKLACALNIHKFFKCDIRISLSGTGPSIHRLWQSAG